MKKLLIELNRTINMLMAHPDNEPSSEFADRIASLIDLRRDIEALQKQVDLLKENRLRVGKSHYFNKYKALQKELEELREDIDFLCTWCSYSTLDENDPHLQHHQDIIKRWKEREEQALNK